MNWDEMKVAMSTDANEFTKPHGCFGRVAACILILILCLCGCKTKEYVYIEYTDTLFVHKTDTVKETQIKVEKKDSIVHDSTIIIKDLEGKTIYVEKWKDRYVNVYKSDSIDKYKSICDSLREKLKEKENKKEVVTKTN